MMELPYKNTSQKSKGSSDVAVLYWRIFFKISQEDTTVHTTEKVSASSLSQLYVLLLSI